jgi:hypothetical protein
MQIKMKTTAAGPRGNYDADKVYEVPDDLASAFIDGGYAEKISRELNPYEQIIATLSENASEATNSGSEQTGTEQQAKETTTPSASAEGDGNVSGTTDQTATTEQSEAKEEAKTESSTDANSVVEAPKRGRRKKDS